MKKKIILNSGSFSYPTTEERKLYSDEIPKITRLNFEYKSAFLNLVENSEVYNAINEEDIYWWNVCLNNRFGKLNETFLYLLTHYDRFKRFDLDANENKFAEDFLYEYYVEIFYYYFFSVRDVLGQLINVLYQLGEKEDRIYLNKSFTKRIPDEKVKLFFQDFIDSTSGSYKHFRNAFNHRFTPTQKDFRAVKTISISVDKKIISVGSEEQISKDDFYDDSKRLMNHLSNLMENFEKVVSVK